MPHRFMQRSGPPSATRIPLNNERERIQVDEPYILLCRHTAAAGWLAVPRQVIRFK